MFTEPNHAGYPHFPRTTQSKRPTVVCLSVPDFLPVHGPALGAGHPGLGTAGVRRHSVASGHARPALAPARNAVRVPVGRYRRVPADGGLRLDPDQPHARRAIAPALGRVAGRPAVPGLRRWLAGMACPGTESGLPATGDDGCRMAHLASQTETPGAHPWWSLACSGPCRLASLPGWTWRSVMAP